MVWSSVRSAAPGPMAWVTALRALAPAPLHQLGARRHNPRRRAGRRTPVVGAGAEMLVGGRPLPRCPSGSVLQAPSFLNLLTQNQRGKRAGNHPDCITAPPPGSLRASPRPPAASAAGSWRRRLRHPWGESKPCHSRDRPQAHGPPSHHLTLAGDPAMTCKQSLLDLQVPDSLCCDGQGVSCHL